MTTYSVAELAKDLGVSPRAIQKTIKGMAEMVSGEYFVAPWLVHAKADHCTTGVETERYTFPCHHSAQPATLTILESGRQEVALPLTNCYPTPLLQDLARRDKRAL